MAPDEKQRNNKKRILFFILFAAVCSSAIVVAVFFLVRGSINWTGSEAVPSGSNQIIRQATSTLLFVEPEVETKKPSVAHPNLGSTLNKLQGSTRNRLQSKESNLYKSTPSVSAVSSMIIINPKFDLQNSSPDVHTTGSSPQFSNSLSYSSVDSTIMSSQSSWIIQNSTTTQTPPPGYIPSDSTVALSAKPSLLTVISMTTQTSSPAYPTDSKIFPTSSPDPPPFQTESSSQTYLPYSRPPMLQTVNTSESLLIRWSDPSAYSTLYNTSLYNQYLQTASYKAQSVFLKSQITDIPTVSNSLTSLSTFQTYVQTLFNSALLSRNSSLPPTISQWSQINSSAINFSEILDAVNIYKLQLLQHPCPLSHQIPQHTRNCTALLLRHCPIKLRKLRTPRPGPHLQRYKLQILPQ